MAPVGVWLRRWRSGYGRCLLGRGWRSLPRRSDAGCERQQQGRYGRSEEHTSELQSLMRLSFAVFCLKNNTIIHFSMITIIQASLYLSYRINTLNIRYDA